MPRAFDGEMALQVIEFYKKHYKHAVFPADPVSWRGAGAGIQGLLHKCAGFRHAPE